MPLHAPDRPARPATRAPSSPLLAAPQAATPMAFVQAIVRAYEQRGLSPEQALKTAQIAPEIVRDSTQRITALQMELLSGAAMQELDDEALGWFERRLPWGSYGMLARASISAPTLGVALKRWCRHHGLIASDVQLQTSEQGNRASITLQEHRALGPLREFCLVSVLRNIHGLACWLIDSRLPLLQAQFPFAAPPHASVYPLLFPGPVGFEAPLARIDFDARYLHMPLRRDEAALQQMLQRALPLTVLQYRRDRLLVQRVRQLLVSQPQDTQSAEALAHWLHISPRTLHRQLKEEGASLQSLKDEVRRDRATELLLRTHKPIKQVAEAAGFRNEKSFIRAFRDWTGHSPAEFRRQPDPA
ncbi:AraC family transcriptional regulator [Curvibacter microcysteis]|uniref:AraC family transcriptional regulator n=1 Tax=Curvibacter microcysteis TaxID=3026419 RepID=UPI003905BFD3